MRSGGGSSGRSCTAGRGRTPRGRWRCSTRRWAGCAGTGCCCRGCRCGPGKCRRSVRSRRSACTPRSPGPLTARTRRCRGPGGHAGGAGGGSVLGAGATASATDADDGHGVRAVAGAGRRDRCVRSGPGAVVAGSAEPAGTPSSVRRTYGACWNRCPASARSAPASSWPTSTSLSVAASRASAPARRNASSNSSRREPDQWCRPPAATAVDPGDHPHRGPLPFMINLSANSCTDVPQGRLNSTLATCEITQRYMSVRRSYTRTVPSGPTCATPRSPCSAWTDTTTSPLPYGITPATPTAPSTCS